jgi:hypothetical protein
VDIKITEQVPQEFEVNPEFMMLDNMLDEKTIGLLGDPV